MSPAMFANHYHTDFIHPLEMPDIVQPEPYKLLSTDTDKSWEKLVGQFESQPDILQLIHICKVEEQKRFYEETKTKLKEYQVIHQLESMQAKDLFSEKLLKQDTDLELPPASSDKESE